MKENFLSLKSNLTQTAEGWEKFYSKPNPWGYVGDFNDRIRNQIIINLVRWSKRKKALDIACGEGSLTKALSPYVKSIKAFDISSRAIESAKKNYAAENIEYFQQDMKEFSSKMGTFDLITCAEVIYYLKPQEIEKVLAEVQKSLAEGGYFVLTTRTDYWFGFDEFVELLQQYFTIVTIVPVWRPDNLFYKAVKRAFSIFSPFLDRVYRSWLLSIDPRKPGMCAYVCMGLAAVS